MTRLDAANLIRVFDFYLAAMFVLSLSRRYLIYWNVVGLLATFNRRWPRLRERLNQHRGQLLTLEVIRPLLLVGGLMLIQFTLSRAVFPSARVTVGQVLESWWMTLSIVAAALPMLAVDGYFLVRVAAFNRASAEASMDQAERWLSGWQAPLVRAVTLGYVNPRKMVDDELKKSLQWIGATTSRTAWWVVAQVGCRTTCGLTIWLLWVAVR